MHDFTGVFQWYGDHCAFSTSTFPNPNDYAVTSIILKNSDAKVIVGDIHPADAVSIHCVKNQ